MSGGLIKLPLSSSLLLEYLNTSDIDIILKEIDAFQYILQQFNIGNLQLCQLEMSVFREFPWVP